MEIREVVAAGPGWTQVRASDGNTYTLSGNRNWRNNNPGNIRASEYANRHGAIGTDGAFAVFPSYDAGRAAKENLLFSSPSYSGLTLSDAISKYAPSFENDTLGYTSRVARDVGVSPDTPLSALSPDQRSRMLDSMQAVEGYRTGKATDQFGNPFDAGLLTSPQAQSTTGIMSVINPPTPSPAPDRGLLAGVQNSWQPATPETVQRGGLLADPRSVPSLSYPSTAPTMAAYSPAKTAPEQLSQQAAAPSFDMGRFGPAPTRPAQDPATIGFDPGRFGVVGPEAVGLAGLKQGLIDQQLNEGILPALTPDPVTTAATPGYVDPQVTTQKTARVQDPQVAQPARALSPEQQALRDAGGILQAQSTPGLAAQVQREMSQRNLTGGLLGGLAGGVLLGPVGALLGGLLGKNYAQKTYYPSAPANPNMTPQQQKANKNGGNGGYGGLSSYGKSVYGSSGQFSSAVNSGSSGLW